MSELLKVQVAIPIGGIEGEVLVLDEPLSFWGGVETSTGEIIDRRHPQLGALVAGRVLVMPSGRGSSSSASAIVEAVRCGTAPIAIVMAEVDPIVTLGAIVAFELYESDLPVLVVGKQGIQGIRTGQKLFISADGSIQHLS